MSAQKTSRVIQKMKEYGLPQILVTSPSSVFYLTGLWIDPGERLLGLLLDETGRCKLFGNEMFSVDPESVGFDCFFHSDDEDPITGLADEVKPGIIGIDKFWPAGFLLSLLEKRPDVNPVPGSDPVDHARMQKDREEIALMRNASERNDRAMASVIGQVREGAEETGLASFLGKTYLDLGADFPVGIQVVCFGKNASNPHHIPEQIGLDSPGSVLLDIFTPFSHYWCDMTRTVFFRDAGVEERKVYETVRLANEEAIKRIRPGIPLSEIDKTARDVISQAGYGEYFTHRLGHGIGIDCHEPPEVSGGSDRIAEPGMIFSIEPGIYLPGVTGVRIEDLVAVTETGCEVLNRYPKDLQVIGG